jgi:hypothetical protein
VAGRQDHRSVRLPVIWAALLLMAIAVPLFTIPLPVTDLVDNLTRAEDDTWADTFARAFRPGVEFRPLLLIWIKLGFEAFGLNAWAYYALLLVQYAAAIGLLVWLFRPVGRRRELAAALAITCFIGLHTSRAMLITVPVNAPSVGVILLLLAAAIAVNASAPRREWLFLPLTACALLLLESGIVLVPLVLGLLLVRAPGVSWRGAALTVAAAAVYLAVRRMGDGSLPSMYTETGFGFGTPSLEELRNIFGDAVWMFWLYNAVSTLFTVLFSEPRAGTYVFVRSVLEGGAPAWLWLHVLSSTLTTAIIVVALTAARPFSPRDRQLIAVGAVLLLAGSALGFLYTRDRIALTAGLGYVVLVYVAIAQVLERLSARPRVPLFRYAIPAAVAALAVLWTCRAIETHFQLRDAAWDVHSEWKARFGEQPAGPPGSVAEQLRAPALTRPPADPRSDPPWTFRYFERKF